MTIKGVNDHGSPQLPVFYYLHHNLLLYNQSFRSKYLFVTFSFLLVAYTESERVGIYKRHDEENRNFEKHKPY